MTVYTSEIQMNPKPPGVSAVTVSSFEISDLRYGPVQGLPVDKFSGTRGTSVVALMPNFPSMKSSHSDSVRQSQTSGNQHLMAQRRKGSNSGKALSTLTLTHLLSCRLLDSVE